jgi:hypothetical protein
VRAVFVGKKWDAQPSANVCACKTSVSDCQPKTGERNRESAECRDLQRIRRAHASERKRPRDAARVFAETAHFHCRFSGRRDDEADVRAVISDGENICAELMI